jgi:hypothetical protein
MTEIDLLTILAADLGLGAAAIWSIVALGKRRVRRFNQDNAVGLQLLHKGELDEARKWFGAQLRNHPRPKGLVKVTRYNLALAEYRSGNLTVAATQLEQLHHDKPPPGLRRAIPGTVALVQALLGDLPAAKRWASIASVQPVSPAALPKDNILLETVMELRDGGRAAVILGRLEGLWRELESSMKGETLRPLRLFRAFATWLSLDARSAAMVDPLLVVLRPVVPGEFDYLAAAWPELAAFLREHGLQRAPALSSSP